MLSLSTSLGLTKDLHVVVLAQYLPLHFVSTMRHLAQKVGRLTLLLAEPMDASRDWTPDFTGLNVQVQKSVRMPIKHRHPMGFEDAGSIIVPVDTMPALLNLKPDVVISVEVGPRTLQAALLKKIGASYKLIVQVRESENTAQSRGAFRRFLRRLILPRVDEVFVNGASGYRHVLSCGVPAARISTVPSGTDTEVFGHSLRQIARSRELQLLYIGQLIPRKGVVPFARVLAKVAGETGRATCWKIAGRGPQESELRAIDWPRNVRMEFLGSRPYRELPDLYAECDAFTMPSLSDEWGMVVNEAMASRLPILGCTGVQSVEELVVDGVSGWTYSPGDDARLAEKLRAVMAATPQTLSEMGARAQEKALEISDEHTASSMLAGVRRVCFGEKGGAGLPKRKTATSAQLS